MNKYFNLNFEFNKSLFKFNFENLINNNTPSYVCVIDTNVLSYSSNNNKFRNILNSSDLNTCDGSLITFILNFLYKINFQTYTGPDIFSDYISKPYKHLLLGNTKNTYNKVLYIAKINGANEKNIYHLDLPFNTIDKFNYVDIANKINNIKPHIIWVSLGAPKQEEFMFILKPMICKGVMVGVGAAFSFYNGDFKRSKIYISSLNFTWIYRLFSEPQKQLNRLFKIIIYLPKIIITEYLTKKNTLNSN